jgi:hypothetical protein
MFSVSDYFCLIYKKIKQCQVKVQNKKANDLKNLPLNLN